MAPAPMPFRGTEDQYKEEFSSPTIPSEDVTLSGSVLPQREKLPSANQALPAESSEAIQAVLAQVETMAQKHVRDGFSEFNFFLGMMNCFLVIFVFCAYPEHFWILFLVQACFLFPSKVITLSRTKPLNNLLYLLEYCWVLTMVGTILMLLFLLSAESLPKCKYLLNLQGLGFECLGSFRMIACTGTSALKTAIDSYLGLWSYNFTCKVSVKKSKSNSSFRGRQLFINLIVAYFSSPFSFSSSISRTFFSYGVRFSHRTALRFKHRP